MVPVPFLAPRRLAGERILHLVEVYRPRRGFGLVIGFPVRCAAIGERRALAAGCSVVHVVEVRPSVSDACGRRCVSRVAGIMDVHEEFPNLGSADRSDPGVAPAPWAGRVVTLAGRFDV